MVYFLPRSCKQKKTKIRQSWKILQLSFTLLHTIIHSFITQQLQNAEIPRADVPP